MWSIERAWGLRASDRPIGSVFARHVRSSCPRRALDPQGHLSRTEPMSERNATRLIPASSHMLVSKIKPCMFKKLVVGPWVGSTGPPLGVHRSARPFYRRYAPGLNWPGRASGAVTLKKLECSKQAYAPDTLAWDNIIGFRSYSRWPSGSDWWSDLSG
ncbi:unnamed protein product [Prunus brigantina]